MKTWALLVAIITSGLGVSVTLAAPCKNADPNAAIPDIKLQVVAQGFRDPVFLTHVTGDSDRLFVVEQSGIIQVLSSSKQRADVFLDIRDRVSSGGERGLLSMAFHPDYKRNGLFYVNYTRASAGRLETVIAEYQRASVGQADKKSERILLTIKQPYSNHNGGQINFGPDGYLYIGTGDGGAGDDPLNSGQDTSTLLGAILRIDVDHRDKGREYAIPADHPYR